MLAARFQTSYNIFKESAMSKFLRGNGAARVAPAARVRHNAGERGDGASRPGSHCDERIAREGLDIRRDRGKRERAKVFTPVSLGADRTRSLGR